MNNMKLLLVGVVIVAVLIAGYLLLSNRTGAPQTNNQDASSQTTTEVGNQEESGTTITLSSAGFEPASITVKKGTSVVWVNQSGGVANVSSDNHPTHLRFPFLNLGNFEDGQTVSVVFEESGTFSYHNHLTPTRTGMVVVE